MKNALSIMHTISFFRCWSSFFRVACKDKVYSLPWWCQGSGWAMLGMRDTGDQCVFRSIRFTQCLK